MIVVMNSDIHSGHEKMGKLILDQLEINYFIKSPNYKLFYVLIYLRFLTNKIFLINGSPYGWLGLKIFSFFLNFKIIEYSPFPELEVMRDRPHHFLAPFINKKVVNLRVLIDDWQIPLSSVKKNLVVRNFL